jgi:steroid delta-isomerase-like uncharacterized protein
MATRDVRGIARQFIHVWGVGHLDLLEQFAAPDIVVDYTHFPTPLRGRAAFRSLLEGTFAFFPDLAISPEEPVVEAAEAVVRWTYAGTHRQGELFGMQPAGRQIRVSGITVYRVENGRVVQERGVVDNLSLLRQLGVELGPTKA